MKDLWLTFSRWSKPAAEGFCNVDWEGKKHYYSISGYSFHMGARATAKEGLWLHSFLQELHSTPNDPLIINCDNQGTIALAKDNKFHMHIKHIDMHYYFIHKAVDDGKIAVQYIPTGDNVSNIFTKLLTKVKFQELTELLGPHTIPHKV